MTQQEFEKLTGCKTLEEYDKISKRKIDERINYYCKKYNLEQPIFSMYWLQSDPIYLKYRKINKMLLNDPCYGPIYLKMDKITKTNNN